MIRGRLLPVFLSMTLLGPMFAAAPAGAETLKPHGTEQSPAQTAPVTPAKSTDGRIPVTRSDGSTGLTRPPDPKEIRKLVGYMRDGMNRADRAEKQRQTRRTIQNKRIYIRK
jgi:hypothetical protein